jgi:antitoxin component YwqK of YwqJK toxin-antitoxin module
MLSMMFVLLGCGDPACPGSAHTQITPSPTATETACVRPVEGELMRDGPFTRTSPDGALLEAATYVSGELEGARTTFYPDGSSASEGAFLRGRAHGMHRSFDEEGQPLEEAEWAFGARAGLTQRWVEGVLREQAEYLDGARHGKSSWFGSSGKPTHDAVYAEDGPDGPFHRYHPSGELAEQGDRGPKGLRGTLTRHDERGALLESIGYRDGLRHGERVVRFGAEQGHEAVWVYVQGEVEGAPSYRSVDGGPLELGAPDGPAVVSDTRGPIVSGTLAKGRRTGPWTSFYGDGTHAALTHWEDGVRKGETQRWSRKGNLRAVEQHEAGRMSAWEVRDDYLAERTTPIWTLPEGRVVALRATQGVAHVLSTTGDWTLLFTDRDEAKARETASMGEPVVSARRLDPERSTLAVQGSTSAFVLRSVGADRLTRLPEGVTADEIYHVGQSSGRSGDQAIFTAGEAARAFAAEDGEALWSTPLPAPAVAAVVLRSLHLAVVADAEGVLHALKTEDGTLLQSLPLGESVLGLTPIRDEVAVLLAAPNGTRLGRVDAQHGDTPLSVAAAYIEQPFAHPMRRVDHDALWVGESVLLGASRVVPLPMVPTDLFATGHHLFGTDGETLFAERRDKTGGARWPEPHVLPEALRCPGELTGGDNDDQSAHQEELLIVACVGGDTVYSVAPNPHQDMDGLTMWWRRLGKRAHVTAVGGTLLIEDSGALTVSDVDTGRTWWTVKASGAATATSDGVFVGGCAPQSLDALDGSERWTARLDPCTAGGRPAVDGDRVYVPYVDEVGAKVAALDRRAGAVVWSMEVTPPEGRRYPRLAGADGGVLVPRSDGLARLGEGEVTHELALKPDAWQADGQTLVVLELSTMRASGYRLSDLKRLWWRSIRPADFEAAGKDPWLQLHEGRVTLGFRYGNDCGDCQDNDSTAALSLDAQSGEPLEDVATELWVYPNRAVGGEAVLRRSSTSWLVHDAYPKPALRLIDVRWTAR